jgi:uncharacterized protein involved in outer membrane biogenesis
VRAFLLIVGLLMVAALTALFAAPVLIDWNAYRGTFEKQATILLGREVRVGGNASLRLLPSPYLHFDNIRIADQTGRFDNPLLRVDGFTLWLSVPPLLRGAIEAREIELDGPDIRLSVDSEGKANWLGLATGETSLPLMPTEVSLASVKITNGRLSITRAGAPPLLAVEGVEGEFAAADLLGPYRFKGKVTHAGAEREVRISTAALAPEHSLKVKVVVRATEGADAVTFDGDILGLDQLPRLAGSLEADLDLGSTQPAAAASEISKPAGAGRMRVTGRFEADLDRGALTEIAATVDSQGRPQLVTGEIAFSWKQVLAIQARLAARWLDLDHIAGAPAGRGPWTALESYTGRFLSAFASGAEMRVIAAIDQATLGGELVNAITLDARRSPAGIEIAALTADLPGATALEITGLLAEEGGTHTFKGPIRLAGTSLGKLLKWAMPGLAVTGPGTSGFYRLGADASLSPAGVTLERLALEIARSRVGGSLRYVAGAPAALTVALDGDRLDLSDIVTEAPTLAGLAGASLDGPSSSAAPASERSIAAMALGLVLATDAQVALRLGELTTGAGRLENVRLEMSRGSGRIDLGTVAFRTGSQLNVEAKGTMASGDGQIRLRVEAPTPDAVAALDRFLALPEVVRGPALRYVVKAPVRLAGTIGRETAKGQSRSEIALDGSAGGERVTLRLRSDKPFAEIASGQTDLTVTMADSDGRRLLSRLAGIAILEPESATAAADADQAPDANGVAALVPGELTLRASGVPKDELTTVLRLAAAGATASFEGEARVAGDVWTTAGRISVVADSANDVLHALGITTSRELATTVDASARISAEADRLTIDGLEAVVDGAKVTGTANVAYAEAEPDLELTLATGRASLPGLLAPLLAAAPMTIESEAEAAVESAAADAEETPSVWSDHPFDFSLLAGWRARLDLKAGTLALAEGLPLEDAALVARSSADGLVLEQLTGNALGGAVTVEGSLSREVAGASLSIRASMRQAELEELFVDPLGRSTAKGVANADLVLKAKSLSPRGMVAVLEGEGELSIEGGQIEGLSPVMIDQAARRLLLDGGKISAEAIGAAIGESRNAAGFPLGTLRTKLTVADGTIRIAPATAQAPQSALRLEGRIDLDAMRLASDWTMMPKPHSPPLLPLPPVTILYEGPVTETRMLVAEADVEALQRDLLARQLIGEPDQLNGMWPDAPPRDGGAIAPDADRMSPAPSKTTDEAADASGTARVTPKASGSATKSASDARPPSPTPAKSKRKTRRKTVTIRETDDFGLR